MDFVLLGYSPDMIRKIVAASDSSSEFSKSEISESRRLHDNPDQENLNQVCYWRDFVLFVESIAKCFAEEKQICTTNTLYYLLIKFWNTFL